jgi:hypothetical protein
MTNDAMNTNSLSRSRGVVMIITLLALILLAGLLFFVINLGRQVNRRVITQHSADAAASAAAAWVARSMNQVAMNNVSSARMIAAVNALDSMPLAVAFTYEDQLVVRDQLTALLRSGQVRQIPRVGGEVEPKLEIMLGELNDEVAQLEQANDFFRQPQIASLIVEMAFYETPNGGRGRFWQSIEAMEKLSIATVESLPDLAQAQSNLAGEVNMPRDDDEKGSLLLPAGPVIPFLHRLQSSPQGRTSFRDFERPARRGLLPEDIDDPITNRGPFDAVFGWRRPWPPRPGDRVSGGRGNTPISRDALVPRDGPIAWEPTMYTPYGPQRWLNDLMTNFRWSRMIHSRFDWWTNIQSNIKDDYLWEQAATRTIIDPQWIGGWSRAAEYFDNDTRRRDVRETCFIALEIRSRYPATHPAFMTPGTWMWAPNLYYPTPRVIRAGGAQDPRTWSATRVAESIWRDQFDERAVYSDPQIGIDPVFDANGDPVIQPVYRVDHFLFIGINVGDPVEVRNPHNFDNINDLPGPVHLNRQFVNDSPEARRQYLTFLAVSYQDDDALAWPGVFRGDKPYKHMVAIAEAKVFNDHSWDLWTPMWRSQLRTVDYYSTWIAAAEDAAASGIPNAAMTSEQIQQLADYMRSTGKLSDVMLAH